MTDVFIGGVGTGKSLSSIFYLYELVETIDGNGNTIKVPRHTLYKRLITNVGGFKPNLFREKSGNTEIEIIHYDRYLYKDDLILIFTEQMKEKDKPQDERTPTLFIYDECQFGLSTFSTAQANLADCEFISNFFSLQRHYGPTDVLLMTQSPDKIHDKYLGIDFHLFIAPSYDLKLNPENDIIFDLYDCDGKNIITGGRNKINYKKTKMLKDTQGNEFSPFDLYVSGDGGRKPVAKKSYWKKYIYILAFLVLFALSSLGYVFWSLFHGLKPSPTVEHATKELNTTQTVKEEQYDLSLPPLNSVNGARGRLSADENSTYNEYIKEPYENIQSQMMYRVFVMDNIYYVGSQILTLEEFKRLVDKQVFFVISSQPVTKRSFYINLLIHQAVINSFGLSKDFDTSDGKARSKTTVKNSN